MSNISIPLTSFFCLFYEVYLCVASFHSDSLDILALTAVAGREGECGQWWCWYQNQPSNYTGSVLGHFWSHKSAVNKAGV